MDTLKSLFFEDPTALYIALGVVELAMFAVWYGRRAGRLLVAMTIPPVLAVIIALVAHLVVTDRERIHDALSAISDSAVAGDLKAAETYLDPNLRGPMRGATFMNRDRWLTVGRSMLERYKVESVKLNQVDTTIAGPNATTRLEMTVTVKDYGPVRIGWQIQWAKRPDGWRVTELTVLHPDFLSALGS
jgi:hypothetical protein